MILRKDSQGLNESEYLTNLPKNNDHIAQAILNDSGHLPAIPPIEIHPYLKDFPLENYEKYIIGTFPPISYIFNHPILVQNNIGQSKLPKIPFYHGNDATFWESFLNDQEKIGLENSQSGLTKKNFLIDVLNNSSINYADIIKSCRRSIINSTDDSDLYNLIINNELIEHVLKNPKVNVVLNFNTSSIFNSQNFAVNQNGFLNDNRVQSLNIFIRALQEMRYNVQISLNGNDYHNLTDLPIPHCYKVLFKMKVSKDSFSKEFLINTTPSPSGQANRRLGVNEIYLSWLAKQKEENKTPTKKFRKEIYFHFRNNNWEALQSMNITF